MVAMIAAAPSADLLEVTDLPTDRPFTIDDLDLLPDDGNRYELDDGVLVVTPPPTMGHQRVVHRLAVTLDAACPAEYEVLPGSGVQISQVQYRIPDIVVIRAGSAQFTDISATESPVLAVEVASPPTAIYDRNRKNDVYAAFGISSYWIVTPDPDKPMITAYDLRDGRYELTAEVGGDDLFTGTRPFACEIVPASLVAGAWRR
jgi:Uma2 family endonuclease